MEIKVVNEDEEYLRERLRQAEIESYIDACALAILSEESLGISSHGHIPESFKSKRPAVQWALERVQYRHAWVCCGPVGGMEDFLKEMDNPNRFKPKR